MAAHHVLLLGGSGKVAQLLTPLLLQRSWSVTSIIRNPDQVANLQKLGENLSGKLNVLVRSLEEIKSEGQAKSLIDEVKPDYVVWSAGAGGKGAPERTFAIDRDAAIHFIRASVATPSITKFLMVSFITSRLRKPTWWDDATWEAEYAKTVKSLERYYQAKVAADQVLVEESKKRKDFAAINLRPGLLTTEPAGKVSLGKLPNATGTSSRASVAKLAALLLDDPNVKSCWLDMLDGDEDPEAAVKRCVAEGVDCAEGEPYY
ncbi:NAD dependent epimerase/dehydratase [Biscogniauxia marginata]|nr:NAD dependent epimerase/dehydratase [Biscogniauxia marginata]